MNLFEHYDAAVANQTISNDALQRKVLMSLQDIADAVSKRHFFGFSLKSKSRIQGLYLYGPVGVGKTYLMDLFYNHVNEQKKLRFHYHHFMQEVDSALRSLQGKRDPLQLIAANLAKKAKLLCLDEFFVKDVADAIILAKLLENLFAHGIILVATSNTAPDDLYRGGVQRDRFLPAISLIKTHCQIIALPTLCDYRLEKMPRQQAYFFPLNEANQQAMQIQFSAIALDPALHGTLRVQNRDIPFIASSERTIWFDFNVICNLPRSQLDYLELATRFDAIFMSNVPQLKSNDTVRVMLLINLVDVLYDERIKLIISAAVPLQELYIEGELHSVFKRTLSRLTEMQSQGYCK